MSQPDPDTQGEHPGSDRHSDQHALEGRQRGDRDAPGGVSVPEDFDVEDPTEAGEGEPVHHNVGGDVGEGAD